MPRGIFNPTVGSGAVYNIQTEDGKTMSVEIDVVGKESVAGKDAYWFESVVSGGAVSPMGQVVMKMLTVPDGTESICVKNDHAVWRPAANGNAHADDAAGTEEADR